METAEDVTFTYRLTIESTVKDGAQYGAVLEALMDAVVKASKELQAEGVPAHIVLRDTSTVDSMVLDLDRLEPDEQDQLEQSRYEVHYRVVTGIDQSVVGENTVTVTAEDEDAAGRRAVDKAHDEDPLTDPRIDPRVEVVSVVEVEPESLTCRECGGEMWIDVNDVSHHWGVGPDSINHDKDYDHVAVAEEAP